MFRKMYKIIFIDIVVKSKYFNFIFSLIFIQYNKIIFDYPELYRCISSAVGTNILSFYDNKLVIKYTHYFFFIKIMSIQFILFKFW